MEEVKEYADKESMNPEVVSIPTVQEVPQTGMIMDAVKMSEENNQKRESMEAAISNDQLKRFQAMAKAWQEAHTQKVRKFDKVGRNDPCPCGAVDENGKPKKFKNCCLNKKDWNILINKK